MSHEKLDFLARMRIRELVLMGLIAVTALIANLPREYVVDRLGIEPKLLLAVLACSVVIGLFLYLKFFFFLAVVLLITGANMPQRIADGLNISRVPLVLALIALVGISLINYVVKLLPTGLEPKPRERSPEAVRAMFYAIERDNLVYAQKVLAMNYDPNLTHENGYTPLAYAVTKGNLQMVELFLRHGADPSLATREGDTPIEHALRLGHAEVAETLRRARRRDTV
ncbi:MAG TPA: ankyrin repeat domain-containing protein [Burkholderiales bacterium]|nr:ankyrin repeat domain-containing protein [Burkholderiales bacterium]